VDSTGGIKKMLYEHGFNSKKQMMEGGQYPEAPFWDFVVFKNMREKLGGRVRLIITGSAPISDEVYRFLKICFCCPVIQGYGLTETSAGGTVTLGSDVTFGNVGGPVPSCEIRLRDVPDMNYFAAQGRGEICFRGGNVFSGYFKDEEKTKEAFDADGFFLTGDIGRWNENGSLSIIDRKKNIFKLSQGEYVAVEYIESIYVKNKYIQQMFAYGDSMQSCLVAIVVPDFDIVLPWAKSNGIENPDDKIALCSNEKVKKFVFDDLNATAKQAKLHGFEFVRAIHLEPEPFSVENGLMTPSFKSMRPKLKEKYQSLIDKMYAGMPPVK